MSSLGEAVEMALTALKFVVITMAVVIVALLGVIAWLILK